MKKKILLLALFLLLPSVSHAVLEDCSQSTVQTAINNSTDGDTITCPAGTFTWTSTVTWNNKNVHLQGNGINSTYINFTTGNTQMFNFGQSNTKAFEISGFTFTTTQLISEDSGYAAIYIQGGYGWRIHHNKFIIKSNVVSYDGGNAIRARYGATGLIDHNIFTGHPSNTGCTHASIYLGGADASGGDEWLEPTQISTGSNLVTYVEDNEFTEPRGADSCDAHMPHALISQAGAIWVFRHNEVHDMNVDSHAFCFGEGFGAREWDINNNQWYVTSGESLWTHMELLSGTGVIWNNVINGPGSTSGDVRLYINRREGSGCGSHSWYGISASTPCPSGGDDGSGYCLGQPGTGDFGAGMPPKLDPIYVWGNTGLDVQVTSASSGFIQSGTEYYLDSGAKPGYTEPGYPYPHPLITEVGDTTPPERFDSTPGSLPAGTTQYTLGATTSEAATCRYSTSSGVAYDSMTYTFSGGGTTDHTAVVGGTTYSDTFTRANENPLNSNWTKSGTGINDLRVVSNKVQGTTDTAYNSAYYSGGSFAADQSSKVTVGGPGIGPMVRIQTGQADMTGYGTRGTIATDPLGAGYLGIFRYDVSSGNQWLSSTANVVSDGDVLEIRIEGSAIIVLKNAAQVSALDITDSNYETGAPGIYTWLNTLTGDDWTGTGLNSLSDGTTYNYYVRCQDTSINLNQNSDDYLIFFTIQEAPPSPGGGGSPPGIPAGVRVTNGSVK